MVCKSSFFPAFSALKTPCLPRDTCRFLDIFKKHLPFQSLPTLLTLSFQLHVLQVDQKQQFVKLSPKSSVLSHLQYAWKQKQNDRKVLCPNNHAACRDAFPLGCSCCFCKKKKKGQFFSGLNALSVQRQADFDMVKWKCFASLPVCLGHG